MAELFLSLFPRHLLVLYFQFPSSQFLYYYSSCSFFDAGVSLYNCILTFFIYILVQLLLIKSPSFVIMKSISSSPALAAIFLSSLVSSVTASCAHNTFLHKRVLHTRAEPSTNETVTTVAVGQFGYIGSLGPTNWQNLTPDNIACSTSSQQSPIDVTNTSTTLTVLGEVKLSIPNLEEAEFENLGTTIEVVMEGKGGTLTIPGGKE